VTRKDRAKRFYGHSTISRRGSKIAQFYARSGEEEGIVSATLNFELLHALRGTNPSHDNFLYELVVEKLNGLFG